MESFFKLIDSIEEQVLALLLGVMTLITFANVVSRYLFNTNILWALEVTVFLFAWLVILGSSYALKKSAHLGVDAVIIILPPHQRRYLGLIAGFAVFSFSFMMFKGAWDFWEEKFRGKGWYETTSTPIPDSFRFLENWFNHGETYEKMPRLVPYLILPLGMGLLLLRSVQAIYRLWTGRIDRVVASHEVEDLPDSVNSEK
ncbi:UNVERIFIED_CONTAM: hypothetical protein GTU68_046704 [Idotea baltica]|nr:hypothetical protein [Idotea baltica]